MIALHAQDEISLTHDGEYIILEQVDSLTGDSDRVSIVGAKNLEMLIAALMQTLDALTSYGPENKASTEAVE